MYKIFLSVAICIFSLSAVHAQKTFVPSDEGSKVHFVIKNLGINTGGDLTGLKGKIIFDAKKPASSLFDVTADVKTIDTDNERRDGHLKNADFFDVEKFPVIRITSTSITAGKDLKNFIFNGTLTIKDVTKTISFPFSAEAKDGGALFNGEFEINRLDFGVGKESVTMSDKLSVSLKVFAK